MIKKKFANEALGKNVEAFVGYKALLIYKITVYLARKAQIALFIAKKVSVPAKYLDYADFSKKN